MSAAVLGYGERPDTGYGASFTLAFVIHAVLIAILFLGVRMQSSAPDVVQVELWEPPPPPQVVETPKPEPKVEPAPEPPKPEPKMEKPEIVEKVKPEPKKPVAKPKPEAPKAKPEPNKRDVDLERRMQEQLALEQAASEERRVKDQLAREQASMRDKALATWIGRIRSAIRGRILAPIAEQVQGNPEAVYQVTLRPSGEVLGTPRLVKSSGNKAYDDELARAILASSPLPKPDQPGLFQRQLELRFRPKDK